MASMASPSSPYLLLLLLLSATLFTPTSSTNSTLSSIRFLCQSTPFPTQCFDSLKLTINPTILTYTLQSLQSLQSAITEASKLSTLLLNPGLVEHQKGSIQDCQELHQITLSSLKKSASIVRRPNARNFANVKAHLSAAVTNKNTCLEGLDGASGPSKPTLVSSMIDAYKHVSSSLSIVSRSGNLWRDHPLSGRFSGGFPMWVSEKDRQIMQSSIGDYDPSSVLTVAADGSRNFTTVSDAVGFAPNNSMERTVIIVKAGVYLEYLEVPKHKTNIVLLGEGSKVTVIRGSRSVGDRWSTFHTATVGVSGEGFLARDITFQNIAGPAKGQAVALRVNAQWSAFYRCVIDGYQDTLYVHSFHQFYRECDIFGTVDFICGNAAVVFQGCNLVAKKPMDGQSNVITAQSRASLDDDTGISIQNCSVVASDELSSSGNGTKTYLGRPWKVYSTTVYIKSYIDRHVDPAGWTPWSGDQGGLDTLYYGEYENRGPGSWTDGRVKWAGYHVMGYEDASKFRVSEFLHGDKWLNTTSIPYDGGI